MAAIEYDKKNKPRYVSESIIKTPFNLPRDNSSPGGLTPIDVQDNRLFAAAIYRNKLTGNSSLWTAHAIGVNRLGQFITGSDSDFVREARTGSRWYKIGDIYTKPALLHSGTVFDDAEPSGRRAKQYFNPSVAANGQGHSIVSGTTDAYNEYLNVFAAGRYLGDEQNKTKAPIKVTNTTALYAPYRDLGGGVHVYSGRWGDFSQTVVDPLDDQTIWTFQEYANVDDSYGIRVVQFKAPPPATPVEIGALWNKTDTTITLDGKSIDNSGFFDRGEDEGGPGYNRLSVTSTGSIVATNIKFISTTKISFTLHTKNKTPGQYFLIITNPDGQVGVTDYTVAEITTTSIVGNNLPAKKSSHDKIKQSFVTSCEIFPNPGQGDVTLQVNAAKDQQARIVLLGTNGKKYLEKNYKFSRGDNKVILPTQRLAKGAYIAVVFSADDVLTATKKFIKQ